MPPSTLFGRGIVASLFVLAKPEWVAFLFELAWISMLAYLRKAAKVFFQFKPYLAAYCLLFLAKTDFSDVSPSAQVSFWKSTLAFSVQEMANKARIKKMVSPGRRLVDHNFETGQ